MKKVLTYSSKYIAIFYDFVAATLAFIVSYYIRFWNWGENFNQLLIYSCLVGCIQMVSFVTFGLYRGIWKFASLEVLKRIIQSSIIAVALSALVLFLWNRLEIFPRSIFMIDWFVLVIFLGFGRFGYRVWRETNVQQRTKVNLKHTLIVGAGNAGARLIREIHSNENLKYKVQGIIDDDKLKIGRTIYDIPILGHVNELKKYVQKYQIETIIIAIPSATSAEMRKIVEACIGVGIEFKTLPSIATLIENETTLTQIRDVLPEDLLGRDSIKIDNQEINSLVNNKVVLITGAGGSIGSELCRQIIKFKPRILILFEINEFSLYEIEKELRLKIANGTTFVPVIGDIRDLSKVDFVLTTHKPDILLHAAAYKHVPLMEFQPLDALRNNVEGTYNVISKSLENNIKRVVIISTDKAVNPTNVMGATKRLSEIITRSISEEMANISKTKIIIVRFGNVLGSSGSVIPLFKEQIAKGGPVTVTHPDVTRYFMSIPEAAQLVLDAGAMGKGGEIFLLDMGKPMKIVDLANEMIALHGKIPGRDIEIKFVGLRPGEKLYEELLANSETTLPTHNAKILIAKLNNQDKGLHESVIKWIRQLDYWSSKEEIKLKIKEFVPEYEIDKRLDI